MKVFREMALKEFSAANCIPDRISRLNDLQLKETEKALLDIYPYGISESELKDVLCNDDVFVPETLGFDSWEQVLQNNN